MTLNVSNEDLVSVISSYKGNGRIEFISDSPLDLMVLEASFEWLGMNNTYIPILKDYVNGKYLDKKSATHLALSPNTISFKIPGGIDLPSKWSLTVCKSMILPKEIVGNNIETDKEYSAVILPRPFKKQEQSFGTILVNRYKLTHVYSKDFNYYLGT